jgi:hypothetical protein
VGGTIFVETWEILQDFAKAATALAAGPISGDIHLKMFATGLRQLFCAVTGLKSLHSLFCS